MKKNINVMTIRGCTMLKHVIMIASLLGVVQAQGAAPGICWALPVTAEDGRRVAEKVSHYRTQAILELKGDSNGGKLKCPFCKIQYKNFDTHIISHPEVGRIYRCSCGQNWAAENYLIAHLEDSKRLRDLYLQHQDRASRQTAPQRPLMIPQPDVSIMSNQRSAGNYQDPATRAAIQEIVRSRPLRQLVQVEEEAYEPLDISPYDQQWLQEAFQAEEQLNLLASHKCEGFYHNGYPEQNEFDDNAQQAEEALWGLFER